MLLDDVRACLRVTHTMTDTEIQMWIDAAIEDMRRCGVKDRLLVPETMDSLAKSAVTCFVKANYGYDNSDAERFMATYTSLLRGMLNSSLNEYLDPEEPEEEESPDSSGEDDTDPADDPDEGNDGGSAGGEGGDG